VRWRSCSSTGLLSLALLASFGSTASAEETGELGLPVWRFQGTIFNSGFGQSLGVYHRLGSRWDAGLELSTDLSNEDDEDDSVESSSDGEVNERHSTRDSDSYDVRLGIEARRWGRIQDKLAWFIGPRIGGRFSWFSSNTESSSMFGTELQHRVEENESRTYTASSAITIGADLQLLKGLSATFILLPIEVSYFWSDRDNGSVTVFNGETLTQDADSDMKGFNVDTDLIPSIYLGLSID